MKKPCRHKNIVEGCRVCWLHINDPRYQRLWNDPLPQNDAAYNLLERKAVQALPTSSNHTCIHLGKVTDEMVTCKTCKGNVQLKLFECAVYGKCTMAKPVEGVACCNGIVKDGVLSPCKERVVAGLIELPITQQQQHNPKSNAHTPLVKELTWAVGMTTVPSRIDSHLPRTLESMHAAGFAEPWLFVDGCSPLQATSYTDRFRTAGVTFRTLPARVHGNWILALYELYIRKPWADRFVIFQDDITVATGTREYLEEVPYPTNGYCNLYTDKSNNGLLRLERKTDTVGWHRSNQRGKGALALVFNRQAVLQLLRSDHMLLRPTPSEEDLHKVGIEQIKRGVWYRGQKAVDGGIVTALMQAGIHEYIHNPSLVQHTGLVSSFSGIKHPVSPTFRGADWDARSLLTQEK